MSDPQKLAEKDQRSMIEEARRILRGDGSDRSDRDTITALWKLLLPGESGLGGSEERDQSSFPPGWDDERRRAAYEAREERMRGQKIRGDSDDPRVRPADSPVGSQSGSNGPRGSLNLSPRRDLATDEKEMSDPQKLAEKIKEAASVPSRTAWPYIEADVLALADRADTYREALEAILAVRLDESVGVDEAINWARVEMRDIARAALATDEEKP